MPTVKINTSDTDWIKQHDYDLGPLVAYGTDIKGAMYFTVEVKVDEVEHAFFAGASMIRFDLGADAPSDHNRNAMYPDTYLVKEAQ